MINEKKKTLRTVCIVLCLSSGIQQVVCGICTSYSGHLYERLAPELGVEDGLTMKNDFCDELVTACDGQITFPTYDAGEDYCAKHTGGDEDQFWSYPYEERESIVVVDLPTPSPNKLRNDWCTISIYSNSAFKTAMSLRLLPSTTEDRPVFHNHASRPQFSGKPRRQ